LAFLLLQLYPVVHMPLPTAGFLLRLSDLCFDLLDNLVYIYLYKDKPLQPIYDNFLDMQIGHFIRQSAHTALVVNVTSALNQHD
jgi:hypothetical protein